VVQQLDNGYQIARIPVNGKTGQRSVRLNNAYPRLKEWLSNGHHPYPGNPNAPLFCGTGKKSIGRRITTHAIYAAYAHYKQVVFPKVLQDPLVPEEDKRKVRDLLKKPWNPHARRHTSATEISKVIKDPILINNYFGWSQTGNTRLKYQHYFADDTIDAMLTVMDGLPLPSQTEENKKKMKDLLKPITCPHCAETNTPESKFCVKCKFVLSFDLYNESINEAEQNKRELAELKAQQQEQFKEMQEKIESLRELSWKKAFRVLELEEKAKRLPPPYIENADKMNLPEILVELSDRGYGCIPIGDAADLYTEGIANTNNNNNNEIINFPPSIAAKLEAKLRRGHPHHIQEKKEKKK
jgi:hypothetical protein